MVLPHVTDNLTKGQIAFAGAMSGCVTRAIIHPIDVFKIRSQLQQQSKMYTGRLSKHSVVLGLWALAHEEGVTALWKGHVPAQLLSISFGLIQFYTFEMLRHEFKRSGVYQKHPKFSHFACGAAAGTATAVITFPYDFMRTRLVAQKEDNIIYKGFLSGISHVLRTEGPLGLYKGVTPTILSVAPSAGLLFMTFHLFDDIYRKLAAVPIHTYNVIGTAIAGGSASAVTKTIFYPLDLLRKRMQVQGFTTDKISQKYMCMEMGKCIIDIYKQDGLRGFFRGIYPTLMKSNIASGLSFATFDTMCHLLNKTVV